jgi:hypothetical protein
VLTHAPPQLVRTFFHQAGMTLTQNGIVVATFLRGDEDYGGTDWVYPDLVTYRTETLQDWASDAGLQLHCIQWPHRNQTYFVAARRGVDLARLFDDALNTYGICFAPRSRDAGPSPNAKSPLDHR